MYLIFQSWSILSADKAQAMFLNCLNMFPLLLIIIFRLSSSTSLNCSVEEEFNSKKAAKICYSKMLTKLDFKSSCKQLDLGKIDCDKRLEKCFEREFIMEMQDFFLEKVINMKQWIFLAQKLLENAHAKSVFYFFSPFLVHFCSVHHLQWFHIFYEECLHVKTIIRTWPVTKMQFMKCASVEEYLSSGRKRVFGPVMSCSQHLNKAEFHNVEGNAGCVCATFSVICAK